MHKLITDQYERSTAILEASDLSDKLRDLVSNLSRFYELDAGEMRIIIGDINEMNDSLNISMNHLQKAIDRKIDGIYLIKPKPYKST